MNDLDNIIYVADVLALAKYTPNSKIYTTNSIIDEVKLNEYKTKELRISLIDSKIQKGEIIIKEPKKQFLREAKDIAVKTGDLKVMSEADISLVALSIELDRKKHKVMVLSDDFAVQNICNEIGMSVLNIVGQKIKKTIKWKNKCILCNKKFPNDYKDKDCNYCGNIIIRKPICKNDA